MSFLIWSSLVVLILAGWTLVNHGLGKLRQSVDRSCLRESGSLGINILKIFSFSFLFPSWFSFVADLVAYYESKLLGRRMYLLGISLSRLGGFLIILAFLFLFLSVNSAQFLMAGAVFWGISRWIRTFSGWAYLFLGLGLFLFGSEMALKQSSLVFAASLEIPFLFSFGDSLWSSVLTAFGISFALSFVAQAPYAGFLLGGLLIRIGLASLPVGIGFVVGESFAYWLLAIIHYRRRTQPSDLWLRLLVAILFSAAMVATLGITQEIAQMIFPGAYSPELRFQQFMFICAVAILGETALSMVVFHFWYSRTSKVQASGKFVLGRQQGALVSPACWQALHELKHRTKV